MIDEETIKKIKQHYELGQGSIQDIARTYRVTVEEVLHVIGQDELLTVETAGDLIDAEDAGPGADVTYTRTYHAKYSTN